MNLQIPYTFAPWGGFRIMASWLDANFTYLLNLISETAPTAPYIASENIAAGAPINLWSNAGTTEVRNANGTSGLQAQGFVLSAVLEGDTADVLFTGEVTGLSGLTPGAAIFLGAGAGVFTQTAPATGSGLYLQNCGFATDVDSAFFFGGPINGPM